MCSCNHSLPDTVLRSEKKSQSCLIQVGTSNRLSLFSPSLGPLLWTDEIKSDFFLNLNIKEILYFFVFPLTLFCFLLPLCAASDSEANRSIVIVKATKKGPGVCVYSDAGRPLVLFHTSGLCAACLTQTQTVSQPPLVKLGFTFESFNCSAVIDAH